jgi:hypothetical protein
MNPITRARLEGHDWLGVFTGVLITTLDGAASLTFKDKNPKTRIKLGLQPDGSPGLEFFDTQGKRTFVAPAPEADGKPILSEKGDKKG